MFWAFESPLDCKEIQPLHPKGDQSWMFIERSDTEAETPILWPPERLKVGGEGNDRGWDGWMASLTQWTWVWVNSGSWWWTGKPGVLQSMGSQRVGQHWVTELTGHLDHKVSTDVFSRVQLCNPMDCSLPGSSIHGISQARILKWVAISFSRGFSQPWDQNHICSLADRFFTTEPPGKPLTGYFVQFSHLT